MNAAELRRQLESTSFIKWERVNTRGESGTEIEWLPIIEAKIKPGPVIGITKSGEWIAVTIHGVTFIEHTKKSAWLLALDYSLEEIRSKINQAIGQVELAEAVCRSLPYDTITNEGLDYGNSPEILSAIRWLEADSSLLNDRIHQKLTEIIDDRSYSQNAKHRAMKLVAAYRRAKRNE